MRALRHPLRAAAAAALAVALLAVLATSVSAAPKAVARAHASGTLKIATSLRITTIDPVAIVGGDQFPLSTMVAETLTSYDQSGNVVPNLAESWTVSPDGLVYTLKIRKGVKFTDGEALDARAVAYSLGRLLSPKAFNARPGTLTVIDAAHVFDKYTLRIKLKERFGAFLAALTLPNAGILAPKSITTAPNSYRTVVQPVGTGPYMVSEWKSGESLTYKVNAGYWGAKPSFETQVYQTVPDASSRVALLQSGQVDVIAAPPASSIDSLKADSNYKLTVAPTSYMIQVWANTASKRATLLRTPKVRKALTYAIDRKTIIDKILFGSGAVPTSPLAPTVFGYCPTGDYSYNPDKAKQMLKEAGAEGLTLKMIAPQGRYLQDYQVAQAVAGYLRAVGLNIDLQPAMDFPTYISKLYVPKEKADHDLALIGFGASYGDPSQALPFETKAIPPNGFNASYYNSNKFDKLMADAFSEADQTKRKDLYCQAQQNLTQFAPSTWLYVQYSPLVTKKGISGIYGVNLWYVTTYAKAS